MSSFFSGKEAVHANGERPFIMGIGASNELRPVLLRRERGFIDALEEGGGLGGVKAVLAFIGHGLIASIGGALDGRPLHGAVLAGDGLAFLGLVALRHGLGAQ